MSLKPGTHLGPYEIMGTVGAGGMGEVYRARDTRLNRDVALKVLPASMATDPERLQRFTIEAQSAGGLNHPNVLTIYEVGTHEGFPYLATELLEGDTLRQRLDAGAVPPSKAIDYARQTATGLAAAHAKGITHRDIKPENLFVTSDGRLKILDFGLAKAAASETPAAAADDATRLEQVTSAGAVLGTAGYMSPEQVRAQPIDSRSDLFSLGVVLYELLSGRRPFVGDSMVETMNAILTADPPELTPATSTLSAVPPALAQIVSHCLEKNPEERFQSARDLAFALAALSNSSVTSGSSISGIAPALAPAVSPGTRRGTLTLVSAALVTSLVLVGYLLYSRPEPGIDLSRYSFRAVATDPEVENSPAWSPDGRTLAYTKEIEGTTQLFIREPGVDDSVQLTQGESDVNDPFWWPDSNRLGFLSQGQLMITSRAGGEPEAWLKDAGAINSIYGAALSPDGETLALWATDSDQRLVGLHVSSPADAVPVKYLSESFEQPCCATPLYLRFSPDGRTLLFSLLDLSADVQPRIWSIPMPRDTGAPRQVFTAAGLGAVPSWSWLPDSRHLVAGFRDAEGPAPGLWLADILDETLTPIAVGLDGQDLPSVSPDGTQIAFVAGGPDHDLVEIPLDATSPVRDLLASSRNEYGGAWMTGGAKFVYVTDRNGVQELRVRGGTDGADRSVVTQREFGSVLTDAGIGGAVVSPDGRRVAYHILGMGGSAAIWVSPIGGGSPSLLLEERTLQMAPTWSPDGQAIAAYRLGEGLSVMQVGRDTAPRVIAADANTTPMAAWSPDGEWIAYANATGLQLVSPDGERRRPLTGEALVGLAWSPDSETIYTLNGETLVAVDVGTGRVRPIRTFDDRVHFGVPTNPGQRFTVSPDGRSLLATTVRVRSDIWILEGFTWPGMKK